MGGLLGGGGGKGYVGPLSNYLGDCPPTPAPPVPTVFQCILSPRSERGRNVRTIGKRRIKMTKQTASTAGPYPTNITPSVNVGR